MLTQKGFESDGSRWEEKAVVYRGDCVISVGENGLFVFTAALQATSSQRDSEQLNCEAKSWERTNKNGFVL